MVNTTQQVGGSLGTALLNTIFTTASPVTWPPTEGGAPRRRRDPRVQHRVHGERDLLGDRRVCSRRWFIRRPAGMTSRPMRRRSRNGSRQLSRADVVSTAWSAPKFSVPTTHLRLSLTAGFDSRPSTPRIGYVGSSVIVFGATGMVGQGVVRECIASPEIDHVVLIGKIVGAHQPRKGARGGGSRSGRGGRVRTGVRRDRRLLLLCRRELGRQVGGRIRAGSRTT